MARVLFLVLVGCTGAVGEPGSSDPIVDPDVPDPDRIDPSERPLRPLSRRELSNTLEALLGREIVGLLDSIPADSHAMVYDRMGAAQTVSALHVDGFLAMAGAIANEAAADDALLTRMMPGCDVGALGPRTRAASVTMNGSSLQGPDPEYGVCYAGDDWSGSNRCPEVTDPEEVKLHFNNTYVTLNQAIAATGRYTLTLDASAAWAGTAEVVVSVDGTEVGRIGIPPARIPAERTYADHSLDLDLSAGDHAIELRRAAPDSSIYLRHVTVTGPADLDAAAERPVRDACATAFVESFAPRAWRRPLTTEEEAELAGFFAMGQEGGFFFDGLRMALEYTLQAPEFLYHVEIGRPSADPALYALDDYELAARLAYLAWGSSPDDELWNAASSGSLATPEQIRAQADRLFADPRAHETVRRFYEQWLQLDDLEYLTKDSELFPEFTSVVRAAMLEETRTFVDELVWNEGATMSDLLTADRTWLPEDLAGIYGASSGAGVALPEGRLGLLTHPSILAINSKPNSHSPVRRGVFVMRRILCTEPPKPPDDVDFNAPDRSTALTTRERFAEHATNARCAACHSQIDPIGFAFENFDGIGRFRVQENGVDIDASAGVPSLGHPLGSFTGVPALARAIAESGEADECLTKQWLRYGLGRGEHELDQESMSELAGTLRAAGILEMMVELTTTSAFRHRIAIEESP
jgi:hypothetical protein